MSDGPIALEDLCAGAVGAANPGEEVEAYAEDVARTQVKVRAGQVESLTFARARGLGIRVIVDGRLGYAYGADPTAEEVTRLVAAARDGARLSEPDPGNVLPAVEAASPIPSIFREGLDVLSTEDKVALALRVEAAAVSSHPEVRRVEAAGYGDSVGRVALASTKGGPVSYRRTDSWATAMALAERDGETQSAYAHRLGREASEVDVEAAGREAAERAARLLGATKPATERLAVILDPVAAASFLGVLAGAMSAESVLKGRSLLAERMGERVGSSAVTLVDDGRLLEGPAVAPFDDEGVATSRKLLVDGGVLRSYLHNTWTSTRSGLPSTGNASRAGYRTVPGVAPSNLFLQPGDLPVERLLAMADRSVYVQDVKGLHSGANPISGEFSVGATGLRVRDGALAEPLREMTIASTLLDVLLAVQAVGSDLRFPLGGGLGSPTVLVGEMTVGGY